LDIPAARTVTRPISSAPAPFRPIAAKMKFDLSTDETLLLVSGVGCAAFGAHAIVAPKNFNDTYMAKVRAWSLRRQSLSSTRPGASSRW